MCVPSLKSLGDPANWVRDFLSFRFDQKAEYTLVVLLAGLQPFAED